MNLLEDVRSITHLKTRPAALIAALNKTQRPLVITQNGEPRAIMQDVRSYESLRKAFLILKYLSLAESHRGKVVPHKKAFSKLLKKFPRARPAS